MCFGSSGQQNSVSKFEPPEWTQQGWKDAISGATGLFGQPYQQYTGMQPGAAPFNSLQNAATDMGYQRATLGAPDLNAGRGAATDVASGSYVNNPFLNQAAVEDAINRNADTMSAAYMRTTAPQAAADFARSGAYGGSAYQQQAAANQAGLDTSIGNMAAQTRLNAQQAQGSDYRNAIQQMLSGGQLGGQLSQDDWMAANNLMNLGTQQQNYTNTLLGQAQTAYNNQMNYPQTQLQNFLNALTQASGGQGTQTSYGAAQNPLSGLLGAGAAGYGIYNIMNGGK